MGVNGNIIPLREGRVTENFAVSLSNKDRITGILMGVPPWQAVVKRKRDEVAGELRSRDGGIINRRQRGQISFPRGTERGDE